MKQRTFNLHLNKFLLSPAKIVKSPFSLTMFVLGGGESASASSTNLCSRNPASTVPESAKRVEDQAGTWLGCGGETVAYHDS